MSKLLSVCMIVKDEEEVLERCLNNLSGLADEIIIIDTGSTDRTKEIASHYTQHVYDFTWCSDFSEARNESLKYATSKWVLVLDADEYIETSDIPSIREFLQNETPLPSTIHSISVVSFIGESIRKGSLSEGAIGRLIPNHFGIKFYRPIHEQLCSAEGVSLLSKRAPITVYHTGYLQSTMSQKDKSTRNKQIFAQLKNKSGFTPYDYFTIGNEYSVQNDFKKALYYYEKSYKKSKPQSMWHYICVVELINNYMRFDRFYEAWEILENESVGKKEYPDYHCIQGIIYEHFGLFELAKQSFKTAISKSEAIAIANPIFWLVNPALALETPLAKLIDIALKEHNSHDATYYLTKKIQSDPSDYASLVQLLELTLSHEDEIAVEKFIGLLFPNPQINDYYLLFKVSLTLGQPNLATTYYNLISNKDLFALHDTLLYSLLCRDQARYEALLNQHEIDLLNKDTLKALSLAYLVWGVKVDTTVISEDDSEKEEEQEDQSYADFLFYTDLINSRFSDKWIEQNQLRIFKLITDLFQLQQYDTFDKYINHFSHPTIIDLLGNYFYSKHQYDIAISYYNTLIDSNELSLLSHTNLAFLHLNDQLHEDAVPFLEEAIKKSPNSRQLYVLLLTHCKDLDIRSNYLKQLFENYPQYRKLPFLQHLL